MSSGKLFSGIILGAIIGVLLAPDKGSETRKKISKAGSGLKDAIVDKFNELGDVLSERYDDIKEEANDILNKGKEETKNVNENIRESFS